VLELGRAAEDDPSDERLVDDAPVRAVDDAPYELRVDVGPPLGRLTPDVGRAALDDEEVAVRPPKLNCPVELRLMAARRCGGGLRRVVQRRAPRAAPNQTAAPPSVGRSRPTHAARAAASDGSNGTTGAAGRCARW